MRANKEFANCDYDHEELQCIEYHQLTIIDEHAAIWFAKSEKKMIIRSLLDSHSHLNFNQRFSFCIAQKNLHLWLSLFVCFFFLYFDYIPEFMHEIPPHERNTNCQLL